MENCAVERATKSSTSHFNGTFGKLNILRFGLLVSLANIGVVFFRGWDGSGHQAIARIFSESVFSDTYGWNYAYFGGMPFPNFYPPVFYWMVGLLAQVFAFETAFELAIILPVIAMQAAIWFFVRI